MKRTILVWVLPVMISMQSCKKQEPFKANGISDSNNKKTNVITFGVAKVLGSNMVMQRDKPVMVWGQAVTGHTITVKASWNATTYSATSNASGDWEVSIPATTTKTTAQNIVVKDNGGSPITLSNILVGDVWVCSGQSNMEMPLDSVSPWPGFPGVQNRVAEIAAANYPNVRLSVIPYWRPVNPEKYINGNAPWTVCSQSTAAAYSAIAYYFGRKLNTTLNVPIGLVEADQSATSCQEWTSLATIQANGYLNAFYGSTPNVSKLYNGMIHPLQKLAIKGFIWDQGEGNYNDYPGMYIYLLASMINNWRTIFNQGDVPFCISAKTPYMQLFGDTALTRIPRFREYQAAAVALRVNTGLAIATDVYEPVAIHTTYKKPVGERLADVALKIAYGQSVAIAGPVYSNYTVNGNQATINFVAGTANGLTTIGGAPLKQEFFLAGTDSIFRKGTASIVGSTIKVTASGSTPLPIKAVRHAFNDQRSTNLINSSLLPASSFRSDNWANAK